MIESPVKPKISMRHSRTRYKFQYVTNESYTNNVSEIDLKAFNEDFKLHNVKMLRIRKSTENDLEKESSDGLLIPKFEKELLAQYKISTVKQDSPIYIPNVDEKIPHEEVTFESGNERDKDKPISELYKRSKSFNGFVKHIKRVITPKKHTKSLDSEIVDEQEILKENKLKKNKKINKKLENTVQLDNFSSSSIL